MSGLGLLQIAVYLVVLTARASTSQPAPSSAGTPSRRVLALAGALARRQVTPASRGTLATTTPTFGVMLFGVIVVLTGLTILPSLLLGPIVEGLS